jgi:hypothetical protein
VKDARRIRNVKRTHRRNLLMLAVLVSTVAALGDALRAQTSPPKPSVSIRRLTTLASRIVTGDFNGDGIVDLASTSATPATGAKPIVVAIGRGDGTFDAPKSSGANGGVLAAGDFNKDGKLDLIAEVADASDMPLKILLGKGDGTFAAPRQIGTGLALAITFGLAADFDGDGSLDVAVGFRGEANDDAVLIYQGHGDGTFTDAVAQLATGTDSAPLGGVAADLNGDGKNDLAVANHDRRSISVFINKGAFTFTASDIPMAEHANDVTAADVNHDGKMDLLVAASADGSDDLYYITGAVKVFRGNGNGTFQAPTSYSTAPGAWKIVVGDFNRDGVADIATANRSATITVDFCGHVWDSVSILPGKADGTFAPASSFFLGSPTNPTSDAFHNSVASLAVGDVNKDGAPDLVASWGAILLNHAPDTNWPPTVSAGPDRAASADHSVVLQAVASDVDQDTLTYTWTDSGGDPIEPSPAPCPFTPTTLGLHTITVTVDDGHGHTASDSVVVDFGSSPVEDHTIHISAPAAGEVVTAGQPYTIRWTAAAAMANEEVFVLLSTDGGATSTHISECDYTQVSVGQCVWQNPGPATDHAIISIVTRDADFPGSGSTGTFIIRAVAGALPFPWQHRDIGAVAKAGSAQYGGGVFTLSGSGADIWGTADELQYAYVDHNATDNRNGVEVIAHVDSVQNVNAWTKAGVMIRSTLDPSSPQASVFVSPSKGIAFQRRLAQGGSSFSTAGPAIAAPVWLRITMQPNGFGETVHAYYKKNVGDPWTSIGQDNTATVWDQPFSGLAVSSHADGTLATGVFSSVSASFIPAWSTAVISPSPGSATLNGDVATIQGRGTDIWNAADQFTYMWENCSGNCTITARVKSLQNTNPWSKAGVMFRETLTAASRQADMIVSPSKGAAMQYRATTGGASAQGGSRAGAAPAWLRITRVGNVFTGYWSTDGVTFTAVGSATVAMPAGVAVGLAVTSHDAATSAAAAFDNIVIQQP